MAAALNRLICLLYIILCIKEDFSVAFKGPLSNSLQSDLALWSCIANNS